jgi:hypothetical protein
MTFGLSLKDIQVILGDSLSILSNFGYVDCHAIPLLSCYSLLGCSLPGDCFSQLTCSPCLESQPGEDLDHVLVSTSLCLTAHGRRGTAIESRNSFLFISGRSA